MRRGIFKGHSQYGGRADFLKISFKDNLLIDTNFSQIHRVDCTFKKRTNEILNKI